MATSTQVVVAAPRMSLLALWHLLSLDAPTVAVVWTWLVARAAGVHLPPAAPLAMGLAVWLLYAGDRLLDARRGSAGADGELEARHHFHHRHRQGFSAGMAAAGVALAMLLPRLEPAAMRLYLIEGAGVVAWFVVVHATRSAHRLPKEIAVGLFFSAAIFVPTVAREMAVGRVELLPAAMLFAALCGLNCLFIYAWEHEGSTGSGRRTAHATTRFACAHLQGLAAGVAVAGAGLAGLERGDLRAVPAACALAAGILLVLDRERRRWGRTTLRAAADAALLTPLLLLPWLR